MYRLQGWCPNGEMGGAGFGIILTPKWKEAVAQSEINQETADMYAKYDGNPYCITYTLKVKDVFVPVTLKEDDYPIWSLSRLISMLPPFISGMKSGCEPHHPELIKSKQGYVLSIRRRTADCLVGTHIEKDPIECCVSMMDWLIKNNHFNKEYLKGGNQ